MNLTPTNSERVARAKAALEVYVQACAGEEGEPVDAQIADLIADLLHLASSHKMSNKINDIVKRGEAYYRHERRLRK